MCCTTAVLSGLGGYLHIAAARAPQCADGLPCDGNAGGQVARSLALSHPDILVSSIVQSNFTVLPPPGRVLVAHRLLQGPDLCLTGPVPAHLCSTTGSMQHCFDATAVHSLPARKTWLFWPYTLLFDQTEQTALPCQEDIPPTCRELGIGILPRATLLFRQLTTLPPPPPPPPFPHIPPGGYSPHLPGAGHCYPGLQPPGARHAGGAVRQR